MSYRGTIDQVLSLTRLGARNAVMPLQNRLFGTSRPLGCKPVNVNIEITNRCCLRCEMCDFWNRDNQDEVSAQSWMNLVDSLKDWLGSFRLTITGGEPFMKPGIWALLQHCIELDLPVVVITNGSCLASDQLRRLRTLHLVQVVISLDSLYPQVHDGVRGVSGAFERTWEAICYLSTHKKPFLLATSTVVTDYNILELGNIALQLSKVGVDRIFFQVIQRGFAIELDPNWLYSSPLWPSSYNRINEGFSSLLVAKAHGAPISHSTNELAHAKSYFLAGSKWIRPWPCSVGYTTFHVDSFGRVRMCPPSARYIGSIHLNSPTEIWNSDRANRERVSILACRKACMLSCNRKYSFAEELDYAKKIVLRLFRSSYGNA